MSKGYVKLWREFVTQEVWRCLSNNDQRVALIHLITSVNWGDSSWMCSKCKKRVELKAGQIAKPMTLLAKEANLGYEQYKRFITTLINTDFLTAQKTKCHNIYTIVNWDVFSGNGIEATTPTPIDNTCKQPLNQPDKIKRSKEKLKEVKSTPTFSEDMLAITDMVKDMVLNVYSGHDIGTIKDWDNSQVRAKWAEYVRRLIKRKKKEVSEIYKVLNWAMEDQFWRKTVKSTSGFYNNYDTIAMQMYGEGSNNNKNTPLSSQSEIGWAHEDDDILQDIKPTKKEKKNGKEQILL